MARPKISALEADVVSSELDEIEAEFQELAEVFGDMGLDEDAEAASDEFSELNAAILGTEFETSDAESSAGLTFIQFADAHLSDLAEQESELPEIWTPWGWLKRKAKRIVKRLVRLVKKYKKYAPCVPLVTAAVVAIKAGKWGTALKTGYSAMKCIRSK